MLFADDVVLFADDVVLLDFQKLMITEATRNYQFSPSQRSTIFITPELTNSNQA